MDEGICGKAPRVQAGQRHNWQDQLWPVCEMRQDCKRGRTMPWAHRKSSEPVQLRNMWKRPDIIRTRMEWKTKYVARYESGPNLRESKTACVCYKKHTCINCMYIYCIRFLWLKIILIGLIHAKGYVIEIRCVFIFLWKFNLSVGECKCSKELYSSQLLTLCSVNTVPPLFETLTYRGFLLLLNMSFFRTY